MAEQPPFGTRPSPLSPAAMGRSLRLESPTWSGDGQHLVWLEGRADRGVLVLAGLTGDAPYDLTGDLNVRAGLGYGGGEFAVGHDHVVFVERSGRLYRQPLAAGPATPITPPFGHAAAPAISPDGRWVVYVHSAEGQDRLAVVDAQGQHWPRSLASGADFYMQPVWHPAGSHLAWVQWDSPNMPWDGSQLYVARVEHQAGLPLLVEPRPVAGGPDTAVFGPAFTPDGTGLAYVSDASGWGQIQLLSLADGSTRALTSEPAEHGAPAWVQGLRTLAFGDQDGTLWFLRAQAGFRQLWRMELATGLAERVAGLEPYDWIDSSLAVAPGGAVALVASAGNIPPRVLVLDPGDARPVRVLARSQGERELPGALARPRAVSWPTADGATAHGLLYAPTSPPLSGQDRPPAVILVHGGPTSQAVAAYDKEAQFLATRGYVVLDVNYRGSTGYGRPFMLALREQWGVADVADVVSAARWLDQAGHADPARIGILGGSAGGYTILQALINHPGVFRAAVCSYGVSSLFGLATDTHKFEARYLDTLVGPLPATASRYRERSPMFQADRIRDPIAIFQGSDDPVVPRAQSDTIVATLRRHGVPHEYHVYEGEGHGWRRADTIKHFYQVVERFLREQLVFD